MHHIWLKHLRKIVIAFKDKVPASKIDICVVVVFVIVRSKTKS